MIWAFLVFFVLAAPMLAGIESALIGVSRVRVRHAADDGDGLARRLSVLLEHRQELLRAAMTAHHVCSVTAFVLVASLCLKAMGPMGILLAAVTATPVFLIGLELAPKALFRLYPFRTLRRLCPVLTVLRATALPWRIFTRRKSEATSPAPAAEKKHGVRLLAGQLIAQKLLPDNCARLIENYASLVTLDARAASTPLTGISAIPSSLPLVAVVQLAARTRNRHHPVLDENGDLIGWLDTAQIPAGQPADRVARHFTQSAPHVSPEDSATRCLQILRRTAAPLAVVTNGDKHATSLVLLDSLTDRLMNLSEKGKTRTGKALA